MDEEEELGQDEESPPKSEKELLENNWLKKECSPKSDEQQSSSSISFRGNNDKKPPEVQEKEKLNNEETSESNEEAAASVPNTTDLGYSLYMCPFFDEIYGVNPHSKRLSVDEVEKIIYDMQPAGAWSVKKTQCGIIASFSDQNDMLGMLKQNLSDLLKGPIQVAQFSTHDTKYRQSVMIREMPWAVPLEEISNALSKQGINAVNIERVRQAIKVEMTDPIQYENLLRSGFDFFGVARFPVLSGRWRFPPTNSMYNMDCREQIQDQPLQCFRCQGFWHIAANCRQQPRCVRCGDSHVVEFCPRPRQNPICCHCAGPHHAAYRHCPVRQQLINATTVSLSLSTVHRNTPHGKRTNLPN